MVFIDVSRKNVVDYTCPYDKKETSIMKEHTQTITESLLKAAGALGEQYKQQALFDMSIEDKVPNRETVISVVEHLRKITFPGFFGSRNMTYADKESFAATILAEIYEMLYKQIKNGLTYVEKIDDCEEIHKKSEALAKEFILRVPEAQALVMKDVEAEFDGDPAAKDREDIIFSYPGLYAIFVYRYAHILYELKIPYIPRIMTEHAHGLTGIDINPGAKIGEYFCIDHGTGIVIGETTEIGNHVKIYQGVTLGALSTRKGQGLAGVKRHPTIEDNVVIYANTTILGGETVVGKNSVIAGNTFVIESIPANTKVASTLPKLELKNM